MSFDKLNDALFAQMDKLAAAKTEDDVKREVERSKAVSALATNIVNNARNAIRVVEMGNDSMLGVAGAVGVHPTVPRMLTGGDDAEG